MYFDLESTSESSEKALNSLCKSLRMMAQKTTSFTFQRTWNNHLRLSVLKNRKFDIPEETIIDCLVDTIKNDIMMPDDFLHCKYRAGGDSTSCKIAKIEHDTKLYLKLNGINPEKYESHIGAAILLLLEKQAEEQSTKAQDHSNRRRKVVVEYVENPISVGISNKAFNSRSLLKTNQSIVLRTMSQDQAVTRNRPSTYPHKSRLNLTSIN